MLPSRSPSKGIPEMNEDTLQAQLDEMTARLRQCKAERDGARAWVRRLQREERTLTCVYCGKAYPPGTPTSGAEVLTEHIKVCPKHPMRAAEVDNAALRAELQAEREAHQHTAHAYEELERESDAAEWNEAREMLRYPPKCGDCDEMKARLIDAQHDEALAIVTLTSTMGERADLRAKLNAAEGATKKAAWILRNDLCAVRVRNALEVLEGALVARPDEAGGSENPADDPAVSLQDVGAGKG